MTSLEVEKEFLDSKFEQDKFDDKLVIKRRNRAQSENDTPLIFRCKNASSSPTKLRSKRHIHDYPNEEEEKKDEKEEEKNKGTGL